MENIIEPDNNFNFNGLTLGIPTSIVGGTFFTTLFYESKKLFIQTPKSLTKQGLIKNGKKINCDLMFNNEDNIFISWLEKLEEKCYDLIYEKSNIWFENKMDKSDIESAFSSPIKIYKSGKYYTLRVNVKPFIKIYDEQYSLLDIENIEPTHTIISIIEVRGIKFTSKNFQYDFIMKQIMIVNPDPFLDNCYIKKPNTLPIIKIQDNNFKNEDNEIKEINKSNTIDNYKIENIIKNKEHLQDLENILNDFIPENKNINNIDTINDEEDNKIIEIYNKEKDLPKTTTITFSDNIIDKNYDDNDMLIIHNDDNIEEDIIFEDLDEINVGEDLGEIHMNDRILNSKDNNIIKNDFIKQKEKYYKLYKDAKEKAKEIKKQALLACIEAENIKKLYMIEDSDNDIDIDI